MRELKRRTSGLQRKPKRNSTGAEMKLWQTLSVRKLAGYKFNRQAKIGRYVVDFICREKYLVVEVEGEPHSDSRRDKIRELALAAKGYRVVRFQNTDISRNIDGVLERLYTALRDR